MWLSEDIMCFKKWVSMISVYICFCQVESMYMRIISAELLQWDIFFLNVLSLIFLYIDSPIKIEVKKKWTPIFAWNKFNLCHISKFWNVTPSFLTFTWDIKCMSICIQSFRKMELLNFFLFALLFDYSKTV